MDEKTGRQISGWLIGVYGGFQLMTLALGLLVIWAACLGFAALAAVAAVSDGEPAAAVGIVVGFVVLGLVYTVLFLPIALYYGVCVASGVSLVRGRDWGVVLASVMSLLGMWMFPLGTVVGIGVLLLLWIPRLSAPSEPTRRVRAAPT